MKIFKSVFLVLAIATAFFSCQKELAFDTDGQASGTFKKDASGNCAPVTVTGIFNQDSTLNNNLFVDIQVNATFPGTFDIKSDTVNGYSFSKTGSIVLGLNTIRLYPSGKPVAAGTNTFTVKFGASTCSFNITVVGPAPPAATFTLSGSPGACSNASIGGTYTVNVPLVASNTLTLEVNVTTTGTYVIGAGTIGGGFIFTGIGVFTTTGLQNVTLTGSGTPLTAGINSVMVTTPGANTCTYDITVLPAGGSPAAAFTMDGNPGNCTTPVVNGTYAQGIATTAANTVVLKVIVTTAGTYNVSTNTVNGISFSGSGTLAAGNQTITLIATGTPTAANTSTFTPNITNSCDFAVTTAPPPPPAVYTLSGAPGACAPITVNGSYFTSTPLNATNTAVIQVNVTTAGTYTLSTNIVNGIKFSATGTFAATGLQSVTLLGSGTPGATAGTTTLTPQIGASSCTFDVVTTVAANGVLTCKIDNVPYTFNFNAEGIYFVANDLLLSGDKAAGSDEFIIDIDKSSTGLPVTAGLYVNSLAGSTAGGYILGISYLDAATNVHWSPHSFLAGNPDGFTVNLITLNATRAKGNFSGTIRENFGQGANIKVVTEGFFDLPIH